MTEQSTSYDGRNLGKYLNAKGIRQDWLAARSNVSRAHLSRIVRGERLASHAVAERIVNVLQVPFFVAFEFPTSSNHVPEGSSADREAVPA